MKTALISEMPTLTSFKTWLQDKVVKPFKQYVTEGAEPSLLAWSASTGFTAGLCPLLGVSTVLALVLHFLLKTCSVHLHLPMLLLANLVSVPVEVACILPFMRLGEFIIRAPKLDAAPVAIKDMIFSNPGAALKGIGHALIGWLLAAPIIIVVLAQILKPILAWAAQRYSTHRQSNDDMHVLMLDQGISDDAEAANYPISYQEPEPLSSSHGGAVMSRRASSSPSK